MAASDRFELVSQVFSAEEASADTLLFEEWQCIECGTIVVWNTGSIHIALAQHSENCEPNGKERAKATSSKAANVPNN